jgi:hypothetical protein
LNIHKGKVATGHGTTLRSLVFEPNTADVQFQLETEIRRVANLDPRLVLNTIRGFPENGILLELEIAVSPFNQAQLLNLFFNNATNTASIQ